MNSRYKQFVQLTSIAIARVRYLCPRWMAGSHERALWSSQTSPCSCSCMVVGLRVRCIHGLDNLFQAFSYLSCSLVSLGCWHDIPSTQVVIPWKANVLFAAFFICLHVQCFVSVLCECCVCVFVAWPRSSCLTSTHEFRCSIWLVLGFLATFMACSHSSG